MRVVVSQSVRPVVVVGSTRPCSVENQMRGPQMIGETAFVRELFETYRTLESGDVKARLQVFRVLVFGIRADDHSLARLAPVIELILLPRRHLWRRIFGRQTPRLRRLWHDFAYSQVISSSGGMLRRTIDLDVCKIVERRRRQQRRRRRRRFGGGRLYVLLGGRRQFFRQQFGQQTL